MREKTKVKDYRQGENERERDKQTNRVGGRDCHTDRQRQGVSERHKQTNRDRREKENLTNTQTDTGKTSEKEGHNKQRGKSERSERGRERLGNPTSVDVLP